MRQILLTLAALILAACGARAQPITNPAPVGAAGAYNSVAPTCTDGQFCYVQVDANGNLKSTTTIAAPSITESVSTAAESGRVAKASAGVLYRITATVTTVSGYLMVFNATAVPADGAVTPAYCCPITSNGTNGAVAVDFSGAPRTMSTGISVTFSSTGCFIKTASATAAFFVGYQ